MYSELDKQYLLSVIICSHLLLYNVVILYFVSVLTPSDWKEAEIHMKCKGILQKAM